MPLNNPPVLTSVEAAVTTETITRTTADTSLQAAYIAADTALSQRIDAVTTTAIVSGGTGITTLSRAALAAPILNIGGDGTTITVNFAAPHGFTDGDYLFISGCVVTPTYNGATGPINVLSTTQITFAKAVAAATEAPTSGFARTIGLFVASTTAFVAGQQLTVTNDLGELHPTTVNGAPAGSVIQMTDAVPATWSGSAKASSTKTVGSTLEELRLMRSAIRKASAVTLSGPAALTYAAQDRYHAHAYGAIGDGLTHPLSERYTTLAAAQAVYSFATALTNEIDRCALQLAANDATANGGGILVTRPGKTYLLDTGLTFSYGVQIETQGQLTWASDASTVRGSILKAATAFTSAVVGKPLINCSGVGGGDQLERVRIGNVTLDGNNVTDVSGIKLWNIRAPHVHDCFIKRCATGLLCGRDTANSVDVSYQFKLERVMVTNGTTGISTAGSLGMVFMNCWALEVRSCTTGVDGAYSGIFIGGFLGGLTGTAFNLYQSGVAGSDVTLIGVNTENCLKDVYADNMAGLQIIGLCSSNSGGPSRSISVDIQNVQGGAIIGGKVSASAGDAAGFIGVNVASTARNIFHASVNYSGYTGSQVPYAIHATGWATHTWHDSGITRTPMIIEPSAGNTGVQNVVRLRRNVDTYDRGRLTTDMKLEWLDPATGAVQTNWYQTSAGNVKSDYTVVAGTGGGSPAGGLKVRDGTLITKHLSATGTLNFGSTAAQSSSDLTVTVTGALVGDEVGLGVPAAAILPDSSFMAWVSAADTVTVRFNNYSSGAQDPASGSFRVSVWQH